MSIEKNRKLMIEQIKRLRGELNESELKKGTKVTIAKDVKYFGGEFDEIVLTNGYKLTADEDTGGEGAYASINGIELKKGDVISFERNVGGDNEYFGEDTYKCFKNILKEVMLANNMHLKEGFDEH